MEEASALRDNVLKSFNPSPLTKGEHISDSTFQPGALHDITNIHRYLDLENKAVAAANLGVYISDMAYINRMKRPEEIQRYFDGCFLLANHVGMKKQFSHIVELRFSEIISGNEAIEKSIGPLFGDAVNTSDGEEFKRMHAAALTGYYFEELFHLIYFIQHPPESGSSSEQINQAKRGDLDILMNQKEQVGHLISYFDHIKLKSGGIAAYQDVLNMQAEYQVLDRVGLSKEKDVSVLLQDKHLQSIIDLIISVRRRITGA